MVIKVLLNLVCLFFEVGVVMAIAGLIIKIWGGGWVVIFNYPVCWEEVAFPGMCLVTFLLFPILVMGLDDSL
jgi:hypothetical protein